MYKLSQSKAKPINGLKKTLVYSSESSRDFIEGVFNIYSMTDRRTSSAVFEDLIEKSVLPENKNARYLCRELFSSECDNITALESIFCDYAAGIDFKARYQNGYDLVKFFQEQTLRLWLKDDKETEGDRMYFAQNFKHIIGRMESDYDGDLEKLSMMHPINYARDLYKEVQECPINFAPINFTNLMLENWETFGDYTYTYRALVGLCRALKNQRQDTAEQRLELIELIKKLSLEWD